MKYIDEEGDLCTLCPATLADCLVHATDMAGRLVVKLELVAAPKLCVTPPSLSSAPEPPVIKAAAAAATVSSEMREKLSNMVTCWAEQFTDQTEQWNECGTSWERGAHHRQCGANL